MAIDVITPSRRGFLGLFAAASTAAVIAAPALPSPAPTDFRSKPVEQWTKADFIAEAEFELAAHTKKAAEVFRVGMTHHEAELHQAHLQFKSWWQIELMERRGDFA